MYQKLFIIILLAIFTSACAQQAAFVSTPPGAQVFIDGEQIGVTPCSYDYKLSNNAEHEVTIAKALKDRGYATGGFGKWGAGGRDSTGIPEKHGFDVFYGYYDQVHAHAFYPKYILRNSEEVPLHGNSGFRTAWSFRRTDTR